MSPGIVLTDDRSPALHSRTFLNEAGVTGLSISIGSLQMPTISGPGYESREIDDAPIFEPGLQDAMHRGYDAALVVSRAQANEFNHDRQHPPAVHFP